MHLTSLIFAAAQLASPIAEHMVLQRDCIVAVRGSRPQCAIAIEDNAEPSVRYAAEELRDHVKKLTGVALDIVKEENRSGTWLKKVSIALSDDPSLGDDGFEVKSTEDSLSRLFRYWLYRKGILLRV